MPYTPLSTANTLQSWRLRINDIDSVKVESLNPTSSGLWAHTGRATISTNLTVSGNVGIGVAPAARLDVAGFTRLGNYGGTFQGVTLQNNNNSASAETISFIDTQNNLGTADGHLFFGHQTDGGSYITLGTTAAGSRTTDRRVERMRIAGSGLVTAFNSMTVTQNITVSGNTITNTILSSDSNLRYRFDTANRRVLTNIYGFDFIDNGGIITPTNKTRYLYGSSGGNQTLVVPAGVFYIFVKMWGAGGGGGSYGGWRQGSLGGAGGFSHGIITVTPGETITIRVGGLGSARPGAARAYPDGGGASSSVGGDNRYVGGGGGSSSILVPSQASAYVMVAGGGGGGGAANSYDLNSGGAGGGLIGEVGHVTGLNGGAHNGKGGTQSAGGAAGNGNNTSGGAGASFSGGTHQNTNCYGGGGGGGYFGGGSGAYGNGNSMGGGGGGSGFIHSSVIMGATYTGQSFIPPFYNDPDLAIDTGFRYARGGDEGGQGGHGLVVLYY